MLSRRHFVKQTAMALPALSLASLLFSSCRKQFIEPTKSKPKIGIIGAGVAGLQAAKLLAEQYNYEVEILEAGDRVGGRILSVENAFDKYDLELGADAMFDQNNAWCSKMGLANMSVVKPESVSTYFINGQSFSNSEITNDNDYNTMLDQMHGMSAYNGNNETTVADYMDMQGVPNKVRFIFREMTQEKLGTSVNRASLKLNSTEGLSKVGGTKYRPKNESFHKVILKEYGNILPYVITNTPVAAIDYTADKVRVTDKLQVVREYDKVIVCVPLSILKLQSNQAGYIRFSPELPEYKNRAMNMLGMDSGVRILLKVNRKFWDHSAKTFYTDGIIGKYEIVQEDLLSNQYILSATVLGENSENNLDLKSENEIINLIQAEWAKSIGTITNNCIVDYKIKYWSKDPYIKGTFSYHKAGGDVNTRRDLAKAVNEKIFFAGEACHYNNQSGTIIGAIETGNSAAKEIVALFA